MIGVLVGVLLRDFGVARYQKKVWKIQDKLIDWNKVKHMARSDLLNE